MNAFANNYLEFLCSDILLLLLTFFRSSTVLFITLKTLKKKDRGRKKSVLPADDSYCC